MRISVLLIGILTAVVIVIGCASTDTKVQECAPVGCALGGPGGGPLTLPMAKVAENIYHCNLNHPPAKDGQILIGWDVNETGKVTDCTVVTNETGYKEIEPCLCNAVRSVEFPPSSVTNSLTYRFNLLAKPGEPQ